MHNNLFVRPMSQLFRDKNNFPGHFVAQVRPTMAMSIFQTFALKASKYCYHPSHLSLAKKHHGEQQVQPGAHAWPRMCFYETHR